MSAPAPVMSVEGRPFWEAAREGRLVVKACTACGRTHYPPRLACPHCWSDKLEWRDSPGLGTVHTFTIMRRAPTPAFASQVPYVVALVDLDPGSAGGVRMMANIIGPDATDVAIGDRVAVCFESRGDEGAQVPQFRISCDP